MDATITTDKVTVAIGALPSLDPHPNAVNIRALRVHIERALQLLSCPQSIHHGWKGLAMSCAMYAPLVTGGTPFRAPTDPGPAAIYTGADPADLRPLTRTEQATIDAIFARHKHYFASYTNINHVVYAALHTSVNEAFQGATSRVLLVGPPEWTYVRCWISCLAHTACPPPPPGRRN